VAACQLGVAWGFVHHMRVKSPNERAARRARSGAGAARSARGPAPPRRDTFPHCPGRAERETSRGERLGRAATAYAASAFFEPDDFSAFFDDESDDDVEDSVFDSFFSLSDRSFSRLRRLVP
jgi:hypothetical protein